MRVALNISSALKPRPTGIARYIENIVPELLEQARIDSGVPELVLGVRPHRWSSRKFSTLARTERRRLRPLVQPYRLFCGKIDLLHSMGAWIPTRATSFKKIMTIHDVHTIERADTVLGSRAERRGAKLRRGARSADAVLTPSLFTRSRVIEQFSLDPDSVFTVHHGIPLDLLLTENPASPARPTRPYLLGSGDAPLRKRGDLLIQAWSRSESSEAFDLVLFGGRGSGCLHLARARAATGHPERIHLLGFVSDRELALLYQHAHGFVCPSEYEGFGLPILEAMAAGCPLAASNLEVFHEIAGSPSESGTASLYFEPRSVDDCSSAIDRLCREGSLREQLKASGRSRAAHFNWEQAARTTLGVYQTVLGR